MEFPGNFSSLEKEVNLQNQGSWVTVTPVKPVPSKMPVVTGGGSWLEKEGVSSSTAATNDGGGGFYSMGGNAAENERHRSDGSSSSSFNWTRSLIKSEEVKPILENSKAVKSEATPSKAKVKITEPNKDTKPTSDDDDDDDDTDEDEDEEDDDISEDEDVKMLGLGEDDDDSDEDDDDEDESSDEEETPKKDDKGKKRVFDSAARTPVSEKKAKQATPVTSTKTDGKKGGHTATPYPKKAGKTPANLSKGKPQTPVSQEKKPGIQASCKTCNRTFNSDQALQSHNKAKHSGGK